MLDNTKEKEMTYLKHLKINIAIASVMLVLILTVGSMSSSSVFAHPPKDIDEVKTNLETKVDNGDLTQEEANEKLSILEEKMAERHAKIENKKQEMNLKIQTAVQNGELTQEEADEKIAHFQEKMENGPKHAKHGKHGKEMRSQIQSALDNGKLTREEADQKFLQIDNVSERLQKVISY